MSFLKSGLSLPHLYSNQNVLNALLCPTGCVVEHTPLHPNTLRSNCHMPVLKSASPSYAFPTSSLGLNDIGPFQISLDDEETTGFDKSFLSKQGLDSAWKQPSSWNIHLDVYPNSDGNSIEDRVMQRKLFNIHGNKGRIPWNKGRKHTTETRALIKQRTVEALKDPKVRKKMSEHPRSHSEANKAKISSSLRLIWAKRLKWKRMRENLFFSWIESLAKAAKTGGGGEEELEWNSDDKINQEVTIRQPECTTVRAKSNKLTKIKGEGAPLGKEKMARINQRSKERDEKAIEETRRKRCRKEKKNADQSLFPHELTLKQRLEKIRRKKYKGVQLSSEAASPISYNPAWKKLDLEIMERENDDKEVSLADQILDAKKQKGKILPLSIPLFLASESST